MFMVIETGPRRTLWLGTFFAGLMLGGAVVLALV